jgi:uncharacterized protein
MVNSASVELSYTVMHGDVIALRQRAPSSFPPDEARFVLDVHLRKLARRLRLLGFDADHREGCDEVTLSSISAGEERILLTRDRGHLMRRVVTRAMRIRSTVPDTQRAEIITRFTLKPLIAPFRR